MASWKLRMPAMTCGSDELDVLPHLAEVEHLEEEKDQQSEQGEFNGDLDGPARASPSYDAAYRLSIPEVARR